MCPPHQPGWKWKAWSFYLIRKSSSGGGRSSCAAIGALLHECRLCTAEQWGAAAAAAHLHPAERGPLQLRADLCVNTGILEHSAVGIGMGGVQPAAGNRAEPHLRICPGVDLWLRPRWFTAWTIILPVQLTRPWGRRGAVTHVYMNVLRFKLWPRASLRLGLLPGRCSCHHHPARRRRCAGSRSHPPLGGFCSARCAWRSACRL